MSVNNMKISEAIEQLKYYLQYYGDCDVCKIRFFSAQPIDKIKFIGGNRILMLIDDEIDREEFSLYQMAEEHRNIDRKRKWQKDCEGE